MWFKQIQLFQLDKSAHYPVSTLIEKLDAFAFQPCAKTMQSTAGWVSVIEEEHSPLVETANTHTMLCLQIEEKILPAAVIQQELNQQIKKIQLSDNRKIGQKEKFSLKEEIVFTLLPRAFSKLTRIYGYIDTKNHWLVLGTTNLKKTEQFISAFKKSVTEKIEAINPPDLKTLSARMTRWLKTQCYSSLFSVEKACVLQDKNQQNRIIRCQEQNLFTSPIQTLLTEGCEVKQLALTWQDRVKFTLTQDFLLQGIKFQEDILESSKEMNAETKQQQFQVDFLIMSETFSALLKDLLHECHNSN